MALRCGLRQCVARQAFLPVAPPSWRLQRRFARILISKEQLEVRGNGGDIRVALHGYEGKPMEIDLTKLGLRDQLLDDVKKVAEEDKVEYSMLPAALLKTVSSLTEIEEAEANAARIRSMILSNAPKEDRQGSFEDVVEFWDRHSDEMKLARQKLEEGEEPTKSLTEYIIMFGQWGARKGADLKEWATLSAEERKKMKEERNKARQHHRLRSDERMASYYQTQELVNLMKFRAVTFDDGSEPGVAKADFEGFSRRICDNYDMFKRTEAYSNLEFHVYRDPSKSEDRFEKSEATNYRHIDDGALTSWMTEGVQRPTETDDKESSGEQQNKRPSRPAPFSVDYQTGEVRVLDTCSPEEFLDFLEREAPRAELRQQALNDEQLKMLETISTTVEKIGIKRFLFNNGVAIVTDKDFKRLKESGREQEYVMPTDIMRVLDELNKKPRLYKRYLKGQALRILPTSPARAYYIDVEKGEICVPRDFYKDTFLPIHRKYERLNKLEIYVRKLRFIAFLIVITLVGDINWPAVWPIA